MTKPNEFFSQYNDLPDIAGEGMLFAFSGLDGTTQSASNFVLTLHNHEFDFLVHTDVRHQLQFHLPRRSTIVAATGDVFAAVFDSELLALSFANWHTLIGIIPQDGELALYDERKEATSSLSVCDAQGAYLALVTDKPKFCLAYGSCASEAEQRAFQGLQMDLESTISERLAIYQRIPHLPDPGRDRLMRKCFSVMKVNTLGAEGVFSQAWSTPDRVPHRDMWLWDSVFHSLGMNYVDPNLAWHFLKSVLDTQHDNGMISHQAKVNGWRSSITQPPVLTWGVWENYQFTHHLDHLNYAVKKLEGYLSWNMANRDQNQNGLLEWFIEENETCRSGESGMDNSQRFDEALALDAVDFSTFMAVDMICLAKIYETLGEPRKAAEWRQSSRQISAAIHQYLWNAEIGFYLDRKLDGTFSPIQAVTGFLPLLLDDFPSERLACLVNALEDRERFHSIYPIPSAALNTGYWSTDMWRGAAWINLNYLVLLGFQKQRRLDLARRISSQTLAMVQKYYEQSGVMYEFYDAKDERSPAECDRKGPRQAPYNIRQKMDSIRDYHWSAALCFVMLNEKRE